MSEESHAHELPEHDALLRLDKDKALADAIGSLFINFALFNSHLNSALTAQLKLTLEQARALVLPLQPRPKIEMISWYAKQHWSKEAFEEVKYICNLARALADFRNDIAHCDMVLPDPSGEVHLASYAGSNRFDPKLRPMPVDDVAHNAMHALHLAREFRSLAIAILEERPFTARR